MDVHQQKTDRPLFRGDRVERDLLVVIDADTADGDASGIARVDLIAALVTDDQIDSYKWSDDGAPDSAAQMTTDWWPPVAIGWLVAEAAPPGGLTSHTLTHSDGDQITHHAIVSGLVNAVGQM